MKSAHRTVILMMYATKTEFPRLSFVVTGRDWNEEASRKIIR